MVKENKELKLTFFPNVLEQFFGGNDDVDSMGNYLLHMEETDVEYNKKTKVVTNLFKHEVI